DAYNTWYVQVEGVVRRITDYDATSRTCTLSASVPGLDDSSTYHLQRASMLDMDGIVDGQLDWLISGVNGSSRRWKLIVSDPVWNPTEGDSDDWSARPLEALYLQQEITANNVIWLTADAHFGAID